MMTRGTGVTQQQVRPFTAIGSSGFDPNSSFSAICSAHKLCRPRRPWRSHLSTHYRSFCSIDEREDSPHTIAVHAMGRSVYFPPARSVFDPSDNRGCGDGFGDIQAQPFELRTVGEVFCQGYRS